ncbi:MAG: cyclodeaminase/cyclohydrolase family protein [Prevotellaceae bacterium]|jgi:formiminotetrahydrofolate cyclodeaminase|nr:cyclodeaminase/cyclohydrolase family protein [Prevotellaceae bacterium]
MLVELTLKDFFAKTAGNDPVPGGGSISALNASLAAALAEMVANLTIGKKKYEDTEALMRKIASAAADFQRGFAADIDADSDAYNAVFEAFKLPKETDNEKIVRSAKIQEATKIAAEIPLNVARKALKMMDIIEQVAENGNQNAVTDACVAMMCARTAVLGAALNVRINLSGIKDEEYVREMTQEISVLEKTAKEREKLLLEKIKL